MRKAISLKDNWQFTGKDGVEQVVQIPHSWNALDNAIEGVRGIREVGRRVIDVLVHSRQRFLVINIINPLEKKLTFRDGLPVTTKGDRGHHGFGLDSIRHIVKKYSGVMTVRTEEGCFNLVIMIPLPQEERGGQV